jgi:serine/threonine protein kinase/tetratricopeptide (TPR) repeat protein
VSAGGDRGTLDSVFGTGRYRVTGKLGQGGMGAVYIAADRLSGQSIAIKRLALTVDESSPTVALRGTGLGGATVTRAPEPIARVDGDTASPMTGPARITPADRQAALALAQEFRILASLRHPNIISVLDYGFDADGQPYVTMELLERAVPITLAAERVDLAGRVELLVQLLQAITYLHRRGILHRDLKPSNILVADGTVRVLDFGLAIERGRRAVAAGTVGYIAPEVLAGEPTTERADLYAIGVIAFELLSGAHPFHDTDERRALEKNRISEAKLRFAPELHAEAAPLIEAGLADLVERMIAREPERRPIDAGQVLQLLCLAAGRAVPAESDALRDSVLRGARFIGRGSERGRLVEALHRMRRGAGSVWQVVGESGAGKSRLLDELRTTALVSGAMVLRGGEVADGGFAYHAWREALRPLALEVATAAPPTAAGAGAAIAWPFVSVVLPDLGELLGAGPMCAPPLDPQTLQFQVMREVEALFRHAPRPVVLLLDDAQWAGAESGALLGWLARAAPSMPLLIVIASQGAPLPLPGAEVVTLARLGRDELAELAVSVVGELGERADLVELLVRDSAGNPQFAIEVLHTLADRAGAIDRIASMILPDAIAPRAIDAAIRARLATLPVEVQRLLAHAAIIGIDFDSELLDALLPGHELRRWFPACQALGLLDAEGARWRFSHTRTRGALLAGLSDDARRALHARVAEALEVRGEAWAPQLAYHWGEAGELAREGQWSALAGGALLRAAAYPRAIGLLERARALLPVRALAPRAAAQAELDIQLGLGTCALVVKGHASPEMTAAFDRAGALCDELGAAGGQIAFQVLFGQAAYTLFRGDIGASLGLAERALAIALDLRDDDLELEARFAIANAQFWLGHLDQALANVDRVLALWTPARIPAHAGRFGQLPRVTVMTAGAWGHCVAGRVDTAVALATEAIDIATQASHPFSEAIARQILGITYALRREPEATGRVAADLIRVGGMFPSYLITARALASWARAAGTHDPAALGDMLEAWGIWHAMGCGLAHTLICGLIGDAHLALGRADDALAAARDGLAWAEAHDERVVIADLHRIAGEAMIAQGDRHAGIAALERALEVATAGGAHLLGLRAACALGWQLVARGEVDRALTLVDKARARVPEGAGGADVQHADELRRRLGAAIDS